MAAHHSLQNEILAMSYRRVRMAIVERESVSTLNQSRIARVSPKLRSPRSPPSPWFSSYSPLAVPPSVSSRPIQLPPISIISDRFRPSRNSLEGETTSTRVPELDPQIGATSHPRLERNALEARRATFEGREYPENGRKRGLGNWQRRTERRRVRSGSVEVQATKRGRGNAVASITAPDERAASLSAGDPMMALCMLGEMPIETSTRWDTHQPRESSELTLLLLASLFSFEISHSEMPSNKSFRTKVVLAKAAKQNRCVSPRRLR